MTRREGWHGWDEYAPFYDWENARTLGRRDIGFWTSAASRASGRVLELGCGTGRILVPLMRAGVDVVGIDRAAAMLARVGQRARRSPRAARGDRRPRIVRGDIRSLPFPDGAFSMVLAPYGILQSLLREGDLRATLESVHRVLAPGGVFGIDLVPDVPNWKEYRGKIKLRGRATGHTHLTLIETVRQEPAKHLTTFEQCYIERRNGKVVRHRFDLTFRTPPIRSVVRRLERIGFTVDTLLGDYRGAPWDDRADAWIVMARRASPA
jgi:SAM-dependent methyltransferase